MGLRSLISKPAGEGFLGRLTNDIHDLIQLLKTRKKFKAPHLVEEDGEKRDSSTKGKDYYSVLFIMEY